MEEHIDNYKVKKDLTTNGIVKLRQNPSDKYLSFRLERLVQEKDEAIFKDICDDIEEEICKLSQYYIESANFYHHIYESVKSLHSFPK